jgi:hypothetical protein
MTAIEAQGVRQPAPCQQSEMLKLLTSIDERLTRLEIFLDKYEPLIARYTNPFGRRYGGKA